MTGRVLSIHIAEAAGGRIEEIESAELVAGCGLRGDRHCREQPGHPERQATLIEAERVEAFNAALGLEIPPGDVRRNIVVAGVDLNSLVGRTFAVGAARLRGVELCEPCAHMATLVRDKWHLEAVSPKQIVAALAGAGGLRAEILDGGVVRPGDAVEVDPAE